MKRILVILFLLFPALALAMSSRPEEPAEETVVSTEICTGLWIVDLVWAPEGRDPQDLVAVFDTGASRAFIDPDALERISGKRVAEGKRAKMEDMWVADRSFRTFKPEVKDLDHISRALGRDLDVFLPFQTFDGYLLVLDYPAGEMRIRKGELPKPDGQRIFDAKGPDDRPWLRIEFGDNRFLILVDSGSSGRLSVQEHRNLNWMDEPVPLRLFQGMYDVELTRSARLDGQALVGPLTFDRPIVTITDGPELLGAQVMQHFVWTFDQKKRRVRMDPATEGPVSTRAQRGSGLVFRPRETCFEVAYVIPGSPAEEAGFAKGDRVTHLDGVPVMERGCRDIEPVVGDTVLLTVVRDGVARDYEIPNVDLVR